MVVGVVLAAGDDGVFAIYKLQKLFRRGGLAAVMAGL